MRKLFTLLILMLTAMAVNAASYNIWVKGLQVTDANKNDVLGDGKVKYDSDNNWLEFIGANITASSKGTTKQERACVYVSQEVTVLIGGNVTMTGSGDYTPFIAAGGNAIKFTTRVGYEANASLTVKSATYRAMEFWGSNPVEFKMMNVNVTGGEYGIYAESSRELKLTCCDFSVTGATNSAPIYGFKSITTEDTSISPKDLTYDTTSRYYKQGGKLYTGTVKFETEKYGIKVAGIEVTARNKKYILGDNNSQVSFDPTSNELTLNNANITTTANNAIDVGNNNKNTSDKTFKIKLIGNNKIAHTVNSSTSLYLWPEKVDSTLIYSTSGGTLEVTANNQYAALGCYIGKIAIKDCTVKLKNNHSTGNALKGYKNATTKYSFINANISAESTGSDVLGDVYGLNYYGCFMTTPTDGFLSASQKLASDGKTNKFVVVPGKDNIKPNFYYGDTPTVESVTTNSAKISFNKAMDNCTPSTNMKYHIFLAKEKATGTWVQDYDLDIDINSSLLKTELKNLKENTKYVLRLKAIDEAGNYDFYKDLEFTTAEDKDPTLPADKAIKYTTYARSIKLNWNAATDDWTPQDQLIYIVEYQKKGASVWKTPEVGNATSYTIENLEPNTTYLIDIRVIDAPNDQPHKYSRYGEIEVTTDIESYGVSVCGTTLTSENLNDFVSQGLTYDPSSKTITLDNANITYTGVAIIAGLGDYTIDLKGDNTINGSEGAIGVALGSLTITSSSNGTLNCSSSDAGSSTLSAPIGVLTIKNCSVEVYNNNGKGLSGAGMGGLVLDNANVKAYGKTGSICDWVQFEMSNSYIDSPLRAEIGGTEKDKNLGIYLNGSPVKGQYVDIKAGANPHIVAPTLPSDANLKLSSTPWNITVEWNAASDNNTSAANLKYWVYVSTVKSNVTSEPWKKIMSAHDQDGAITGSGSTFKLTTQEYSEEINSVWGSMEPNTTFYVTVVVEDEDGNCALYNVGTVSTLSDADTTKPTLPADATVKVTEATENSLTISWDAASDNKTDAANLKYEINVQIDGAWNTLATLTGVTEYKIEGLKPESKYKIVIYVSDESGNQCPYDALTASTEAADAIEAILAADPDVKMYNTSGVLVGKNYRGVVIINGKKYIKK